MKLTAKRSSEILAEVIEEAKRRHSYTLGELVDALRDRALGIIILVFALPNTLPLSAIPGFAAILSIPILIVGILLLIGVKHIWLPNWIAKRDIADTKFAHILESSLPYVRKIERLLKPRWTFITSTVGERILGLVIILLAFLLMLPIPLSNFIFAILISVIALGLVERDGVFISVGVIASLLAFIGLYQALMIVITKLFY